MQLRLATWFAILCSLKFFENTYRQLIGKGKFYLFPLSMKLFLWWIIFTLSANGQTKTLSNFYFHKIKHQLKQQKWVSVFVKRKCCLPSYFWGPHPCYIESFVHVWKCAMCTSCTSYVLINREVLRPDMTRHKCTASAQELAFYLIM